MCFSFKNSGTSFGFVGTLVDPFYLVLIGSFPAGFIVFLWKLWEKKQM
jgi:hypothetical protein